MPSLAVAERSRICDTALAAGADAPTLCGEWTVVDLMAHLVVREGNPLGAPGIVVPRLEFLTDRAMARAARDGLEPLVERVRHPPLWSPSRIPAVDRLINTIELYVHHEDVRRAAADWAPRALEEAEQREIWSGLATPGKGLVRPAGVPVSICWSVHGTERVQVLKAGPDPVVVTGQPSELAMFLFGRDQHRDLAFTGPDDSVARLRGASLGA